MTRTPPARSPQDVLAGQVGALTGDTELVTTSIGGNDAGFADVMADCNPGSDDSCVARNQEAQDFARTELPGRLDSVYTKIGGRAPGARVVVLGHPHIHRLDGGCDVGLSETKRAAVNGSADVLAEVISARAGAFGFTFVDGRPAIECRSSGTGPAGHRVDGCGTRG